MNKSLPKMKLSQITTKIGSGATPLGGKESYKDTGITLIRSLNVYDFEFVKEGLAFIDETQADQLANVAVQSQDVLLNITGASVARCCMVPDDILPGRVNQHVSIVRVAPHKADPRFVQYALTSPACKSQLLSIAQGGATREALTKEKIEDFEIPYPSVPTQRKIASILSAYDDLIENNTRRIKILEEMAQTIYREWFVEFRAPGVELRPATREEQKVTGKPARQRSGGDVFPKGWEIVKLGEIAEEKRRGVNPSEIDQDTPYFGLEHLPRKSIALSDWGSAKEVQSTKLAFQKREILFGKIRPYFHKVGVAPLDGVCSSDTIVIVPKLEEFFGLVLGCVSSEAFVNHATQTSQGTKMPRANWDVLVKYTVVKPDQNTLIEFNQLVGNIVDLIINTIFRNRNLRRTRDLLLPKLVNGEIRIENVEVRMSNESANGEVRMTNEETMT